MIEYYHKCIIVGALSCLFMYVGRRKFTAFENKLCYIVCNDTVKCHYYSVKCCFNVNDIF